GFVSRCTWVKRVPVLDGGDGLSASVGGRGTMFDRLVSTFLLSVISSALLCTSGNGQVRSSHRLSHLFALDPCISEQDGSGGRHIARLSVDSYLRTANECDGPEPDRWRVPYEPAQTLPRRPSASVDAELSALGSAGFVVAGARQ